MLVPSIVWIASQGASESKPLADKLQEAGANVAFCAAGNSKSVTAPLRVLPVACFRNLEEFHSEYVKDPRPTLILAESPDEALRIFAFANGFDDIALVGDSVEMLACRLSRLASCANDLDQLRASRNVDALTGLLNRRKFETELRQILEDMLPGEAKALMMLDLDRFKVINGRFGHTAGDQVITHVARLLRTEASPDDRFARYGGEEFICLLSRYDPQTVEIDAEKVLERIRNTEIYLTGKSEPLRVTASAGLVFLEPHSQIAEATRCADMALYAAKEKGRNCLVQYEHLHKSLVHEDEDPYLRHFENVTRVVSERVTSQITLMGRRLVETARREANEDSITGLKNRRYFDKRMPREVENSKKNGRPLTIAMMDLDKFHDINTEYLWQSGDRVLRNFAVVAAGSVRQVDWLSRIGGEEFCVVMPDTDLVMGCKVAERIRSQLESSVVESIDGRRISVTASIGVAELARETDDLLALTEKAQKAVLEAKRLGRNRVIPWSNGQADLLLQTSPLATADVVTNVSPGPATERTPSSI